MTSAQSAPAQSAIDRLERVLVMVPWLLDHPGATFSQIAAQFGATTADVASDLDILGYCGLPGYGGGDLVQVTTVGDSVTVRLADFFQRPLRLSLREAVTMLLAAQSWAQVEGLPESAALRRAIQRLDTLIGDSAGFDDSGDSRARVARLAIDLRSVGDHFIAPLRAAVIERRVVRVVYRSASKGEVTTRDIEPWSVVGSGGAWYLRGYCRSAQAHRDFRLDRIRTLDVLDERAASTEPDALEEVGYRPSSTDISVHFDIRRPSWWALDGMHLERMTDHGEWRAVHMRVGELEWLARRLLFLAADVRVHEPRELIERMGELLAMLLSQYQDRNPNPDSAPTD